MGVCRAPSVLHCWQRTLAGRGVFAVHGLVGGSGMAQIGGLAIAWIRKLARAYCRRLDGKRVHPAKVVEVFGCFTPSQGGVFTGGC